MVNVNTTTSGESHQNGSESIMFLAFAFAVGALCRHTMSRFQIPYSVTLLLVGIMLGGLAHWSPWIHSYCSIAKMDPHLMLQLFLPVLIFESAFLTDTHTFRRCVTQVFLLAGPGLILATLMTSLIGLYVFNYNWSFVESLLFSAIISATDPVAVVALLKELGASKQLAIIIEGESLFNDGLAILLYNLLLTAVLTPGSLTIENLALYTARMVFGGPSFGMLCGKVIVMWISHIYNDALAEITITLATAYVVYYIAEIFLGISGVLAVVFLGLEVSKHKTCISAEIEHFLHDFWEMLSYLANTVIFLIVGIQISLQAFQSIEPIDIFYLIALYMGITVVRLIMIFIFSPILSRVGYGSTWQEMFVMSWGGLRGAVGLALALSVQQNPNIPSALGDRVLFHTAGIVLLTLLLNATSLRYVLKVLKMNEVTHGKKLVVATAITELQHMMQMQIDQLKSDRFLRDCNWDVVEEACKIVDPYAEVSKEDKSKGEEKTIYDIAKESTQTCPVCESALHNMLSPTDMINLGEDSRRRFLRAQKTSFWRQYEEGLLGRTAVQSLVAATDEAEDKRDGLTRASNIEHHWQVARIYTKISEWIDRFFIVEEDEHPKPPFKIFAGICWLVHQAWFEAFIFFIIILNICTFALDLIYDPPFQSHLKAVQMFGAIYVSAYNASSTHETLITEAYRAAYPLDLYIYTTLQIVNYVFTGIYTIEFLLKIMGLGKLYWKSPWNIFDFLLLILAFVDVIMELFLDESAIAFSPTFFKFAKAFKSLRVSRLLRLFKLSKPLLVNWVHLQINKRLSFGYDVGIGYVIAQEEICDLMYMITENQNIAKELKRRSENCQLQVVKSLGMLRQKHPRIAVAVKTRQSIRTVLTHAKDSIIKLKTSGQLDEKEAKLLSNKVEMNIKRLHLAATNLKEPNPEEILRSVPWLSDFPQSDIDVLISHCELREYTAGDIVVYQGDESDGVLCLVEGMLRMFGQSGTVEFTDYIGPGGVIGEMGFLSGSPRGANVECETDSKCYFIPGSVMTKYLKEWPALETRLWKLCTIRLSIRVLIKVDRFSHMGGTRLRIMCETGHLLSPKEDTITPLKKGMTLILVKGVAMTLNVDNRRTFHSPCLIPSGFMALRFYKSARVLQINEYQEAGDDEISGLSYLEEHDGTDELKEHWAEQNDGIGGNQPVKPKMRNFMRSSINNTSSLAALTVLAIQAKVKVKTVRSRMDANTHQEKPVKTSPETSEKESGGLYVENGKVLSALSPNVWKNLT